MKTGKTLLVFIFLIGLAVGGLGRGLLDNNRSEGSEDALVKTSITKASTSSDIVDLQQGSSRETTVIKLACEAVERIKEKDYKSFAELIHPEKGVLFAPYSTVDPDVNLSFQAKEIAEMQQNHEKYIWGVLDGKGTPIKMTLEEYFDAFVFDTDYSVAPEIGINRILKTGNSLENVLQVYEDGTTIEFHIPSTDPKMEGMDWRSLKLVFEPYETTYKIVAIVHSQWTI